jgi:phosphopantetheinyl transferase (holo-ACP synthase)
MVLGVGVDIITLSRMKDALETSGKVFLDKVFTPWEQKKTRSRKNA